MNAPNKCPTFVIRQLRTGGFCSCNLLFHRTRLWALLQKDLISAPQNPTTASHNVHSGLGGMAQWGKPCPYVSTQTAGSVSRTHTWTEAVATLSGSPWGITLWSRLHRSTWREAHLPWDRSRLSQAHPSDVQAPGTGTELEVLYPLLLASVSLSPHHTLKPLWVCVCECVCGGGC